MNDNEPSSPKLKLTRAMALETLVKDADDLIHHRPQALGALVHSLTVVQSLPTHCRWTPFEDDGFPVWKRACGGLFVLSESTFTNSDVHYCPDCGSPVEIPIDPDNNQPTEGK